MDLNFIDEVTRAVRRIKDQVRLTPIEYSPTLSDLTGGKVFLKCENYQLTGSFKIRGALNKLTKVKEHGGAERVVAASTGNHAEAVASAADRLNLRATIYMPTNVSPAKLEKLKRYPTIDVVLIGDDCIVSEEEARSKAELEDIPYISPYNDREVIMGQGTIGFELKDQCESMDAVLVPVGGGGLISGVAGYLKNIMPELKVFGCQPHKSKVMYESIKAGEILDLPSQPTISDGTAGGIESGSITFEIVQKYVDDFEIVSEDEIFNALKYLIKEHRMIVEGSAGLSVASLIRRKGELQGLNVVCILCGNKITDELLKKVVAA